MPDSSTVFLFAVAAFFLTATPGPDMLLIASRSISQGRTAGLLTFLGIALGTYCHALAAGLGLSKLFLAMPLAYEALRWAGCFYLLYLAVKTLYSKTELRLQSENAKCPSYKRIFSEGLMTNLLNPKMAFFVLALFPQFLDPTKGSILLQIFLLATVLNVAGFLVNGSVILIAAQVRVRAGKIMRFRRLPQYLMAFVFTGLAVRLAFGSRN